MFLTVVSRQDGDLLSWISNESHVHESGNDVFSFRQVLIEVRRRLRFTDSVEIADINELMHLLNFALQLMLKHK